LIFICAESGLGGEGTGFRSLKEPFDNPAFVKTIGEAFAVGTLPSSKIEKGEFEISLGQLAFATYKVNLKCLNTYERC
jgi:hypothetical protein